jgi:hypothetical protein
MQGLVWLLILDTFRTFLGDSNANCLSIKNLLATAPGLSLGALHAKAAGQRAKRSVVTSVEIARALPKCRKSGTGHLASCPAHEDDDPSLWVTERDGKPLVHCHAGCSQDAVIDALKALGLWPEREQLVENVLPSTGATLMFGAPKCNKTLLAVQAGIAVASAHPLCDYYRVVEPGAVLMVEQDDPAGAASLKSILERSAVPVAGIPFYLAAQIPFSRLAVNRMVIHATRRRTMQRSIECAHRSASSASRSPA